MVDLTKDWSCIISENCLYFKGCLIPLLAPDMFLLFLSKKEKEKKTRKKQMDSF